MSEKTQNQISRIDPASFTVRPSGILQRACACGNHAIGGKCPECSDKNVSLQRTSQSSGLGTQNSDAVPPIVYEVLHSSGQPLDPATRAYMEPRFGHDFSQVRVHSSTRAADSARAVNALAYTVGKNIVFGTGRYTPSTTSGQRLLAHELTHVLQQRPAGNEAAIQGNVGIGNSGDVGENEAERIAETVTSRPEPSRVSGPKISSPATLRRTCADGRCEDCAGGPRDFWVTVFFRRRATQDTMNKLRTEINNAKAILANCCLNLKFDFDWTLLPGGGSLPAYEGDPAGAWHYTAEEQALGEGTTFSSARGIPMLLVDDVPLSGGGVTIDPRFDTTYTGRRYFAIGINQTTTPNPNCNHIAHELWHVASGLSAHDPANGTVTSCTGQGVSLTYCNGLRAIVAPRGDFPLPRRGPGATRMA